MKPNLCHPCGNYNFEVASKFLEYLCTPEMYHFIEHLYARQTSFIIRVFLFAAYNESRKFNI
jgi:hypothetical protein